MPSSEKSSYFDTDKVEPHGYFQTYVMLAGEIGPKGRVCELGVENGESLRMWRSLFPLGEVVGVDADKDAVWPAGTVKVVGRQEDPRLSDELDGMFDLIVDDASHDGLLTQQSWFSLWRKVKPGGYYVIEDWAVALRSDERWGGCWGPGMLKVAESFLPMMAYRDGQIDEIRYRFGLIVIRKNPHYTEKAA
jgi:hypothetical protein